ncbi:MAG TPA: hypothetical protein PK674_03355 [Candidatus Absconditabacterales bacterium]|nr:hypothetical protein [Candidatus Absconditabacterales bacterium]HOQ79244.1 hypothetical protein [Candidatus Absconditabacterales bacterium]HPK28079.1 hypothetical protein [Candidatus Absconditabacterales bacterium]
MSKSKTNNLTPKEQAKKSGEAFLKAGKNILQTTKGAVKTVWNTGEGLYHLVEAGDLAIHNKLGKSSNKIVNFTKRNIIKILLATSILTCSGAKVYQHQKDKDPNKIELYEDLDKNIIDLKNIGYKIKTPNSLRRKNLDLLKGRDIDSLKGEKILDSLKLRKVGDLYSYYLGYGGEPVEIGDTIIFKPNEIIALLYQRKFNRKNRKGFTVAKEFYDKTVSNINFNNVVPSSLDLMTKNINDAIKEVNENFDREKFGKERLKNNKSKINLFKKICDKIDQKCLIAYGMTEIMPSRDGELNKEVLDFLLKNGGERFVMNLPAVNDDYASFGFYQLTSKAVFDTGDEKKGGVSKMNLYMPKEHKVPGSVIMLQGQDHHKAAYLFAMYNLYTLVFKADSEMVKALELLANQQDNNDLTQLIAIMHNLPKNGQPFLYEWYKLNTDKNYLHQKTHNKKGKPYNYDLNGNKKIDLYESFVSPKTSHNYGKKTYYNRKSL